MDATVNIHVCQLCNRDICEPGQPLCRGCESDLVIERMRQYAEAAYREPPYYQTIANIAGMIVLAISVSVFWGTIGFLFWKIIHGALSR